MKILALIILLTASYTSFSQDESLGFQTQTDTTILSDTIQKLDFTTEKKGIVTVNKSEKLDEVTKFVSQNKDDISKEKISGYRIQIYFNENKSTALGQKAYFLSVYGDHKAYLDYMAPNYRVRVGNFRTKLEAEKLKQELLANYPTCIVIEDNIELPKINIEE